jgi:hypothetical protein
VSDQEFLFSVELSDEARFDTMLIDLAAAVLGQVGSRPADLGAVTAALRGALAADAVRTPRRCDVRFQADGGWLHVVLSCSGRPAWRTSLAIPR